jgi:integrase
MACAWGRTRHKLHCGQFIDITFAPQHSCPRPAQSLSEILGLRWPAIDWDGLRLAVRQAYVYGKQGDVKTQASQRWMPLDRSLADKLRKHKARLAPLAKSND